MADYFSQIVVRPFIPKTAMTELEYVILARMFDAEPVGEDTRRARTGHPRARGISRPNRC